MSRRVPRSVHSSRASCPVSFVSVRGSRRSWRWGPLRSGFERARWRARRSTSAPATASILARGWATQRENTNGIVEDLVATETMVPVPRPDAGQCGRHRGVAARVGSQPKPGDRRRRGARLHRGRPRRPFTDSSVSGYGAAVAAAGQRGEPVHAGRQPADGGERREAPRLLRRSGWRTSRRTGDYNVYVSYTPFSYRVPGRTLRGAARRRRSTLPGEPAPARAHLGVPRALPLQAGAGPGARGGGGAQRRVGAGQPCRWTRCASAAGWGLHDTTGRRDSGRPRFEEAARYHAQFMGAPQEVYDNPSYS